MSIHGDGELERAGDITSSVKRIDKIFSVDLVVKPGAGGAIVSVLESIREARMRGNLRERYEYPQKEKTQMKFKHVLRESGMDYEIYEDDYGNEYILPGDEDLYEDDEEFYDCLLYTSPSPRD